MLGIPIRVMTSATGLKICAIDAGIQKVNNKEKEKEARSNSNVSKI